MSALDKKVVWLHLHLQKQLGTDGRLFFSLTFFTAQSLVNYKCVITASKVNSSNTYSVEYANI